MHRLLHRIVSDVRRAFRTEEMWMSQHLVGVAWCAEWWLRSNLLPLLGAMLRWPSFLDTKVEHLYKSEAGSHGV